MRRFLLRFLVLSVVCGLGANAAEPQRDPVVMIIDSSGSMAARMGNATKLDAARAALDGMLADWPAEAPLAIVAYGHRRTADCADIETIVPLGPLDRAAAEAKLRSLRAKGKTPLTDSLMHAAGLLGETGGGNIVLVSDGIETCAPDPCAAAEALHKARATVKIFVVGFDVSGDERAQLSCIAEKGGGAYFAADGAAALDDALGAAREAAVETPPPPPPEPQPDPLVIGPALPVPPLTPFAMPAAAPFPSAVLYSVSFVAVLGEGGPPLDLPVDWTIRSADGADYLYQGNGRGLQLQLEEGSYTAAVRIANAEGDRTVTLEAQPGDAIPVPVRAGEARFSVVPSAGGEPIGDTEQASLAWTLEPLAGQAAVTMPPLARPAFVLAPGRYRAAVTAQGEAAAGEIDVQPGQSSSLVLNLALGRVTLEAATSADGEPIAGSQGLSWTLTSPGTPPRVYERANTSRPDFTVPAGEYEVALKIGGGSIAMPVRIEDGQDKTERLLVPVSKVTLSAALAPGEPLFDDWRETMWTVTANDVAGLAPGTVIIGGQPIANPQLDLMPGNYTATVASLNNTASASASIDVVPGQPLERRIDLNAATLTVTGSPESDDPPDALYEVAPYQPDGSVAAALIRLGQRVPAEFVLLPGRYRITVTLGSESATADIDLKIGDRRALTLIPGTSP
jgi:Ca-activated chloride channel family protein